MLNSSAVKRIACFIAILTGAAILLAAGPPSHQPLHLNSRADRDAFRRWFTFLSEAEFYAPTPPPEIADCAALVRWSFRESIVPHDAKWANTLHLISMPAIPAVQQFAYPRTPSGADLFQTGENSSAQFADATTLRRFNTWFISRNLEQAMPGDLIFYRQFGHSMPAHVMIYIGPSQVEPSSDRWIVYHTGPSANTRGEIRKVKVADLLAHPSPEWRPIPGNSNFLGIRRLNILRDTE